MHVPPLDDVCYVAVDKALRLSVRSTHLLRYINNLKTRDSYLIAARSLAARASASDLLLGA